MAIFHKILALVLFLVFVLQAAYAYGSLATSSYAKTKVGETAIFEILFWSENQEEITFHVNSSDKLLVNILPNPLLLNPFRKDGEIVFGGKIHNVSKVKVFVTPKDVGRFDIEIFARREVPVKGITFVDERVFKFVVETETQEIQEKEGKIQESQEPVLAPHFSKTSTNNQTIIFALLVILIIFVSFLIYRYS